MAIQEHLEVLKQGTDTWNEWRQLHAEVRADLSDADLSRAHLEGAYLNRADLSRADLSHADLNHALQPHFFEATLR